MDRAILLSNELFGQLLGALLLLHLLSVGFVELVDDFLRHFRHVGGKDWLERTHECLEERVVEDFVAQVEHFTKASLRFLNTGSWVSTGSLPGFFVVQGRHLQDYLDFRRINPLQLSLKLSDRSVLLQY